MYMLMLLDIVITGGVNLRSNFSPSVQNNSIIKDRTMSIKVFSLEIGLVGVYKNLHYAS